jgi:hypothetical protein
MGDIFMDYNKIYYSIIDRAKHRTMNDKEYYEKHHIVPKCMDGTDDDDNLVNLTAREHFVAHQLLCRIHPNNHKLVLAVMMMCVDNINRNKRNNNKLYEWIRRKFVDNHPSKTEEGREKIRKGLKKYCSSPEFEKKKKILYGNRKEERSCQCGCGEIFEVSKKSSQKFIYKHHRKIGSTTSLETRMKQSEAAKRYLSTFSKDEMSKRMKNSFGSANAEERGKKISASKKGKKTNQQEIVGKKYAAMSDSEFEKFIENRTEGVRKRIKRLRNEWSKNSNKLEKH